ncbi:regulatory-associated protein of mTOR-like [Planoprotostelium fungivorum]|uniref:Regulatory-associated protein of mTOR-like n=1 Tax=Planoprotostelium fungivorum TaxID=1890364 RepID=A0A2P6MNW5_9EUKA|nr:regulatory-associated protein of mTOR-like [Planoprotostelium fungivorum]
MTEHQHRNESNERLSLTEPRHRSNGNPTSGQKKIVKWRMNERMKTVSVAMVYCLNIGTDPPDVVKPDPCARLECWIDPFKSQPSKALENIGKALQAGYERLQPRARHKIALDPTSENAKKMCQSERKNAKDERVLFHYNGHGVPKPTHSGEIWFFNKNFTQYIPLSIYDLQSWLGCPSIYVFDCNYAGLIVNWFLTFAEQREKDAAASQGKVSSESAPMKDFILLASCGAEDLLPMSPELPADVFTACLLTPIKMALRWFCSNSLIAKPITHDMLDRIPGKLADRKTPLGELNWVFTAITDTIGWNVLPRGDEFSLIFRLVGLKITDVFQKLFRQDLLVANVFRNFLLAERVLKSLNCTPISHPKLPPTHQHPMWEAWDLAVDNCLAQLPAMLENPNIEYSPLPFFSEQLTAFEIWIKSASEKKEAPGQLPIVLQVLLAQAHRLRALILLADFLDLGSWAVNLALSVGIFPYVLKLLQVVDTELRKVLVFIWAKILALDKSCQLDLVKDNGHSYFIKELSSSSAASQRVQAAFILSVVTNNCRPGQSACLEGGLLTQCNLLLNDPDPMMRRWAVLCMGKLWESFEEAKTFAVHSNAHEKLCAVLTDPVPEVRAAAVFSLGLFIGGSEKDEARSSIELNIGITLPIVTEDASPMVRKELVISLSRLVRCYESQFRQVADGGEKKKGREEEERSNDNNQPASVFPMLWKVITSMISDPHPEVSSMAESVVKMINPSFYNETIPLPPLRGSNSSRKALTSSTRKKPLLGLLSSSATNTRPPSDSPPSSGRESQVTTPSHNLPNSPSHILAAAASALLSPLSKNHSHADLRAMAESHEEDPVEYVELQSVYYEWSCEYFAGPIRSAQRPDDHHAEKIWRKRRNDTIKQNLRTSVHFEENSEKVVHIRLDQVAVMDVSESTTRVLLHTFEPTILIADDRDGIAVWDREAAVRISRFRNVSGPSQEVLARTTSMNLMNETDNTLLLIGSDDGIIRIWSGYDEPNGSGIHDRIEPKLVTAWKAIPSLIPSGRGAGLVTHWQQSRCHLFASGDTNVIRLWDMDKEALVQDIVTGSDSCVTTLTSNSDTGAVIAGFGDGSIRVYDARTPGRYGTVMTLSEHREWVLGVEMRGSSKRVISGSTAGDVRFWDMSQPVSSSKNFHPFTSNMSAIAVHRHTPVLACGSSSQKIKIYNFNGEEMNEIRYHDGFLGQRIGPVSCLQFHSLSTVLAGGSTDSLVSLYSANYSNQKMKM